MRIYLKDLCGVFGLVGSMIPSFLKSSSLVFANSIRRPGVDLDAGLLMILI